MALQHTPDATIINVTLPDGTETAFSFGEYLAWRREMLIPIPEKDHQDYLEFLLPEDAEYNRQAAWVSVVDLRKKKPGNPAVVRFRQYAIENNIPI